MLKLELQDEAPQTSRPYFPVRHWRRTPVAKPAGSITEENEIKRPIVQLAESLEIALRSFNKYGG
ncbi:MAG: hypothetical protein V7750_12070 [Sneathiella sp.]